MRGFAARTGVAVGRMRSVLDGRDAGVSTVAVVCRALGLEFYIGRPRDTGSYGKTTPVTPNEASDDPPLFKINDEKFWDLIGAFADEWEAADEHGRGMLETRFRAYFPELTGGRRRRVVRDELPAK